MGKQRRKKNTFKKRMKKKEKKRYEHGDKDLNYRKRNRTKGLQKLVDDIMGE